MQRAGDKMRLPVLPMLVTALIIQVACAGVSARQLQQSGGTFTYPGCLPIDQSVVATNPDFSDLYLELNISGVLDILSDLQSPVTLFAFTNAAQEESVASFNHTVSQADSDPLIASAVYDGKLYTIVTEAVPELADFEDGESLATLLGPALQPGAPGVSNLTVRVDTSNDSETVTLESYASIVTIVTPAQYACNVIIYGISGVLIPTGFVDFEDTLDHYLEVILRPGGAELPASFIVEAVNAGEIATVAAAFDDVVAQGYTQQLVALLKQAVRVPGGVVALASVANEMIVQSGCATLQPLIRQLYPSAYATPESLGLSAADLEDVPAMDPLLASCALRGV